MREITLNPVPLWPVTGPQKLAFLDTETILCTKDAPDLSFSAGVHYPIKVIAVPATELVTEPKLQPDGSVVERTYRREFKTISIHIGEHAFSERDFGFIESHFAIPDPPTIAETEFERYLDMRNMLKILEDTLKFELRPFQYDAIARMLLAGRGVLAFEPGLGKTVAGLAFAAAVTIRPRYNALDKRDTKTIAHRLFARPFSPRVLIVCPQGLIPQWQEQAHRFLKISLKEIRNPQDARRLSPPFWAIASYEAISRTGTARGLKPAYAYMPKLKCLIIDEAHYLKGDTLRSKALRGLAPKAHNILALTATPIKEFAADLFYVLGTTIGWKSPRFPYSTKQKAKFASTFCVIKRRIQGNKVVGTTIEPKLSNTPALWRIIATTTIPVSLASCGEKLVPYTLSIERAEFSEEQLQSYKNWLFRFVEWYCSRHPKANPKFVERHSAVLGQYVRLQFACSLPEYQPAWPAPNMTPKNKRILEQVGDIVRSGEQVVLFSARKLAGRWFSQELGKLGIRAETILSPHNETLPPPARAKIIQRFKNGDFPVLCLSTGSAAEGYDLNTIPNLILHSVDWSHSTFVQTIARVRRLSSTKPISVTVYLTEGSIEDEIFSRIAQKKISAQTALFGSLTDDDTRTIQEIIQAHQKNFLS